MTTLPIEPTPVSSASGPYEPAQPLTREGDVEAGTLESGNETGVPDTSRDFPASTDEGVELGQPSEGAGGPVDALPSTQGGQSQDATFAKVPGMETHVNEGESRPGFKEKVQGFHKVFRGHVFGNADQKEEGKRILRGDN